MIAYGRHIVTRFSLQMMNQKKTGKSFFTFLAEYRIDLACDMLQKTDKSVAEICFESGFGDVPYFNRTFKKMKGMTPKEYRNLQ